MHRNIATFFELDFLFDSSSEDEQINLYYSTEWTRNIKNMPDSQFSESFRMGRECFKSLLKRIKEYNSCLMHSEEKLMIFIFYFAHISTYRKLREIFGISHPTLFRIIKEIGKIIHKIARKEIKFPRQDEYDELKEGFLRLSNNYGPILAIDGTLVNITKPKTDDPFNYYDRKSHFSVNFVCVVDHKQRFRGVAYGFGKCHDARIYRGSNLRTLIENISDESCYVLGDSAYGGFDRIRITASTNANPLSPDEEFMYSQQRIIVENAFGRLKGKFKRLEHRIYNGESEKYIICIQGIMWIHNFIIDHD